MPPLAVIERFNVNDDGSCSFFAGGVVAAMHFLDFQRMPETFHWRVVIAVARAAHRLPHAIIFEYFAESLARILAAAVGMKHQSRVFTRVLSKPP